MDAPLCTDGVGNVKEEEHMRCPICNAPTDVEDSRQRKETNCVIRKRKCFNDHIFKTEEKIQGDKLLRPVHKSRPKAAGTDVPSSTEGKT